MAPTQCGLSMWILTVALLFSPCTTANREFLKHHEMFNFSEDYVKTIIKPSKMMIIGDRKVFWIGYNQTLMGSALIGRALNLSSNWGFVRVQLVNYPKREPRDVPLINWTDLLNYVEVILITVLFIILLNALGLFLIDFAREPIGELYVMKRSDYGAHLPLHLISNENTVLCIDLDFLE